MQNLFSGLRSSLKAHFWFAFWGALALTFSFPQSSVAQAPFIQSVVAFGDPNPIIVQVIVDFNEALDSVTAEEEGNYAISDGVTVLGASLSPDGQTVTLDTSALFEGVTYTLTVNDVEDLLGNAIAPNSQATFEFLEDNLLDGLVAYWPLDDGAGLTAADVTGSGHDGILENGPVWTADPALAFDGIDDYVDVGTLGVTGTAVTLTARLRAEDLANCVARACRILSKAGGTAEQAHDFMLSTIASGAATRLRFRLKTNGTTTTLIASAGDIIENTWVHVTAVYDGAAMRLYQDGVEVGSRSKSGSVTDSGSAVWIGANPPDGAEPWAGQLAEVRIYDRALSAPEIQSLVAVLSNQAPVASDASVVTDQDMAVAITLQAADPDGDPLTYSVIAGPMDGTLSGTAPDLIYTPDPLFSGADAFDFEVDDGKGGLDTATVSITVNPAPPGNTDPVADAQSVTTNANIARLISLAGSDTDGDPLTFGIATNPSNGSLSPLTPTSATSAEVTYTPNSGFFGPDSFTFRVDDGQGGVDTATVTITVALSPSGLVPDGFDAAGLDPVWTFVDPLGDSSVALTGSQVAIGVSAGTAHDLVGTANHAPRIRQAANDTDFTLEVKFDSALTAATQLQGVVVEEDTSNLVRFDFSYASATSTRVFAASLANGMLTTHINGTIPNAVPYLRVTRVGDVWTQSYSTDGVSWVDAGTFMHVLSVTSVGVFAGNAGAAPAHTALVDYFLVDPPVE